MIYIRQYAPSLGAKALAEGLGGKRIKTRNSTYRYRPGHIVINWGSGREFDGEIALNKPSAVRKAANKIHTFMLLNARDVPTVEWTCSKSVAKDWHDAGMTVYCRGTVIGQGGTGITVVKPNESFPQEVFPLYTKAFPTYREFRVHVVGNKAVRILEKKKKRDYNGHDEYVRSHRRGWVFCANNLEPYNDNVVQTAVAAVNGLDLDFGGVDLAVDRNGKAVVLEVNTAPGLEGSTIPAYVNAIKEIITNG